MSTFHPKLGCRRFVSHSKSLLASLVVVWNACFSSKLGMLSMVSHVFAEEPEDYNESVAIACFLIPFHVFFASFRIIMRARIEPFSVAKAWEYNMVASSSGMCWHYCADASVLLHLSLYMATYILAYSNGVLNSGYKKMFTNGAWCWFSVVTSKAQSSPRGSSKAAWLNFSGVAQSSTKHLLVYYHSAFS